jgi:hypothetical protein
MMTWEEAQREAIARGALKPQGFAEGLSANINNYNGGLWANTPLAQARLKAWTEEIHNQANNPR